MKQLKLQVIVQSAATAFGTEGFQARAYNGNSAQIAVGLTRTTREQAETDAAAMLHKNVKTLELKDRMSGHKIYLTFRDGEVVGAMGSEPGRYMGLTEREARHMARYSNR